MDWYLDARDVAAVSALRREIAGYLERHADPETSDLAASELITAELLANASRHTPGPTWVSLTWPSESPELVVHDLGSGFDLARQIEESGDPTEIREGGFGLKLVAKMAPRLDAVSRRAGGAVVRAELPARRPPEPSFAVPDRPLASLPNVDEAAAEGFDRETFLRALVVELAQAVERVGGPEMTEAMVTQVGSGVGAQMEAEFRRARELVGRLTTEQAAECMVRLKHAIDGNFTVTEINDDRIVLTNDRCPFGEVVRRAPALCRMTSSVFGGIAARTTDSGQASVVLEERIAVGDPGCRVVVHLGPPQPDEVRFAHRY